MFCLSTSFSRFPFLSAPRGLSALTLAPPSPGATAPRPRPAATRGALTAVVLVLLVPAVVHAIAVEQLRQASGGVAAGEVAQGARDLLPAAGSHCEEGGQRGLPEALRRATPPRSTLLPSWHPGGCHPPVQPHPAPQPDASYFPRTPTPKGCSFPCPQRMPGFSALCFFSRFPPGMSSPSLFFYEMSAHTLQWSSIPLFSFKNISSNHFKNHDFLALLLLA